MQHYSGDPHWTRARYPGQCRRCQGQIPQDSPIFYYPKGKHTYCQNCGQEAEREFLAMAQDEAMYRIS